MLWNWHYFDQHFILTGSPNTGNSKKTIPRKLFVQISLIHPCLCFIWLFRLLPLHFHCWQGAITGPRHWTMRNSIQTKLEKPTQLNFMVSLVWYKVTMETSLDQVPTVFVLLQKDLGYCSSFQTQVNTGTSLNPSKLVKVWLNLRCKANSASFQCQHNAFSTEGNSTLSWTRSKILF